jgi:hypothetical protein
MRIRLEKKGEALIPSLPIDEIALGGVKQNQIVEVELKRPRNAMFHKKFFALIGIVLENTEYQNSEQVLHLIKIKLGYYDTVINTDGEVFYMPRSISFSSMDNDSFGMFYNDTVDIVLSDFLTNWQDSDIQNAIDQVVRF